MPHRVGHLLIPLLEVNEKAMEDRFGCSRETES